MAERDHRPVYTIASSLHRKLAKSDTFMTWPHHVTLVPPFHMDSQERLSAICREVGELADEHEPIEVMAGSQTHFRGVQEQIRLLADHNALYDLHHDLLDIVIKNRAELIDSTHIREAYMPHVTFKKQSGANDPWPELGDAVRVDGLELVRREPDRNDLKTVLAHYAFRGWKRLD